MLCIVVHRLDKAANVAIAECKGLKPVGIAGCGRNMIGHQHVFVADFLIRLDSLDHVHIALIGVYLDKVITAAADVAEVDVEDLVAPAKVADDVVYLVARIGKHFGDRALTKVEAVVWAFLNGDEALQPVDSAKYAVNRLVAFGWDAGVLRVAGHANFVLVGNWDDTVEEVGNPFSESLSIDVPGDGERRGRMRFGELPYAVHFITAARLPAAAEDAENAHVVFDGGQASLRTVADKRLDALDVTVPLRALRQHDSGMFLAVDIAGFENLWTDTDNLDVILFGEIAHPVQLLDGGEDTAAGGVDLRVSADVAHAVARKVLEVFVGGWALWQPSFINACHRGLTSAEIGDDLGKDALLVTAKAATLKAVRNLRRFMCMKVTYEGFAVRNPCIRS
jgi:hypothetical protein